MIYNAFVPSFRMTIPTSLFCHVGTTPPARHRFCAMSGKHLWPDIAFLPCRGNASGPTSFLRHVGTTPLARHRFCAMSGKRLCTDIVSAPCQDNTSGPTSFLHHVGATLKSLKMLKTQMIFGVSRLFINSIIIIIVFKLIIYRYSC